MLFSKTIEKGQDQIGIDIPGNLDVTMTSQQYCEKGTSLNRFGRRLVIVGQQVMLNKLELTFQVIYDVTMTSQRCWEKGTSLYRFGRRLGIVGQQVMLNKLALTFQVIYYIITFLFAGLL